MLHDGGMILVGQNSARRLRQKLMTRPRMRVRLSILTCIDRLCSCGRVCCYPMNARKRGILLSWGSVTGVNEAFVFPPARNKPNRDSRPTAGSLGYYCKKQGGFEGPQFCRIQKLFAKIPLSELFIISCDRSWIQLISLSSLHKHILCMT